MPQYQTEFVLRARLVQLPNVESWFGWSGETVEQDNGGARVAIVEDGGARREILEADYVGVATGVTPASAGRSASSAAGRISTSSWCWPCSARASFTSD